MGTPVLFLILQEKFSTFYHWVKWKLWACHLWPLKCWGTSPFYTHYVENFYHERMISSFHSLSHVQLFATPGTASRQASMSITNSWNPPKPMSIQSVMPSNHLILCRPLLLLPSIFPSITIFSKESVLCLGWPKYWIFSFSISPSNEYSGLISFRITGYISLQSKGLSRTLQLKSINSSALSFLYSPTVTSIQDWLLGNHSFD